MEPLTLHSLHQTLGARFVEVSGREVVEGYGRDSSDYQAARHGAALFDLSAREFLQLTGADRVSFLHGMVTQDVKGLPEQGVGYAALLTSKGAMVTDARLWRRSEDLVIETEPGLSAKAAEFLNRYLISEDAELHPATDSLALLSVMGPRALEVLAASVGGPMAVSGKRFEVLRIGETEVLATAPQQLAAPGVDLLLPRTGLETVYRKLLEVGAPLGLVSAGFSTFEVLRVEAGLPRFGQDMGETTIPLEANLERAISYNKGCYIGQEVVARATFRGQMGRKLTGLLLDVDAVAGAELFREGKKVGWVTSVVHSPARGQTVALGYVHRTALDPGTVLTLESPAGKATVTPLPFV